jgi:hypothetical protein
MEKFRYLPKEDQVVCAAEKRTIGKIPPGEWDALLFFGSRLPEMLAVEKMRTREPSEDDSLDQR